MSHQKRCMLFITLVIALLLASCMPASPAVTAAPPTLSSDFAEEIVKDLVDARMQAMQAKDIDQYMSLVNQDDKEFYTEQRNWFLIYQDALTTGFSIDVQDAEQLDDGTIIATLRQHYLYGTEKADRTFSYEEKFIRTPAGWKDADLNFEISETPHFLVKYQPDLVQEAAEVCKDAEIAYSSVLKVLQVAPQGKVTIKLYADQELLRQSSDIRVAYLFTGWNEDGESIKLYARRGRASFEAVLAHELVHQITLGISDSQPSWLAEGLAMYFGSQPLEGGNALQLEDASASDLALPVSWLEETNLIESDDGQTVRLYYAVSGMLVQFMVETYGLDHVKALLDELSKFPRYDRGFDYGAMELENQKRLHQAIQAVLGLDMDAFNEQWLSWIQSQG